MLSLMLYEYGWSGINFNLLFVDMVILLGFNWLVILFYMEVVVLLFGIGVFFVVVIGCVLCVMEENGYIFKFLGKINKKYNILCVVIVFNVIISMVMVILFCDWGILVVVIFIVILVVYLIGLIMVILLCKMVLKMICLFKVNILKFMVFLFFVLVLLVIYWVMWLIIVEVILIIILGLFIYFFYEYKMNWKNIKK